MQFYYINSDYINYLKQTDSKNVQNNYEGAKNQKPYVGILLKVKNHDYFAPLSSDKSGKYAKIKKSNPTVYKLKTHNNNYLGVIKINNMIPVKKENITLIDISKIEDEPYKKLLNTQRGIINDNKKEIQQRAESLYDLVANKKNSFYSNISAKFKELEKACDNYQQKQVNSEKIYSIEFSYEKKYSEAHGSKSYGVYVNDQPSALAIKDDPQVAKVLEKIAERKEFLDKGITAESLKVGLISPRKLENEFKITRPDNLTVDSSGKNVQVQITEKESSSAR